MPDPTPRPGDVLLIASRDPYGRLVALGQRLRFPASQARWTHCAFVTTADGGLIEAVAHGVEASSLAAYTSRGVEVRLISVGATAEDRAEGVRHALTLFRQHDRYGWLQIASVGLRLLLPGPLGFQADRTCICSELVASCLFAEGYEFSTETSQVKPADLARMADAGAFARDPGAAP